MDQGATGRDRRFESDFVRNFLQLAVVIIAVLSLFLAIVGYNAQAKNLRIAATMDHLKRVQDESFTDALWDLEDFTKCYEDSKKAFLSYRRFDEINSRQEREASKALAGGWWKYLEDDDQLAFCARGGGPREPLELERKLFLVYERLEGLASCGVSGLCDLDLIVKNLSMRECIELGRKRKINKAQLLGVREHANQYLLASLDWQTVLVISNYILLSSSVAREWDVEAGNFSLLIQRLEWYSHCEGGVAEHLKDLRTMRKGYSQAKRRMPERDRQ